MKPRLLSFVAVILLFAPLLHADEWNKTYKVSGKPELRIDSGDGSIDVNPGPPGEISVELTTRGYRIGEHGVRIEESQTGNTVEVILHFPDVHFSFGNHSAHLDVRVPPELSADLHTGDGHIELSGLKGSLLLRTGDGHVTADNVDGSLQVKTGDGKVRASGRFDQLDIHTGDGSIEVEARNGSRNQLGWTITTSDGHVDLTLPADFSADLDVHTGDGHITSDLPVTVSGEMNRNTLRGKMNQGGPTLKIRTGDGSIRLEKL